MSFLALVLSLRVVGSPVPAGQASPLPASLQFLSLGDWGDSRYGSGLLKLLPLLREEFRKEKSPSFVLLLGDNFYVHGGLTSVDDPGWRLWTHILRRVAGTKEIPFYVALGNHDLPFWKVQQEFSDGMWTLPARYYSVVERFDSGSLCMVVLDTFGPKAAGSRFLWLLETLSSPACLDASYVVLVVHKPLAVRGKYGHKTSSVQDLEPLVRRFSIDLILSGHEHSMQHGRVGRAHQVVSGAGSRFSDLSLPKHQHTRGKIVEAKGRVFGYTRHSVTSRRLRTEFVAVNASGSHEPVELQAFNIRPLKEGRRAAYARECTTEECMLKHLGECQNAFFGNVSLAAKAACEAIRGAGEDEILPMPDEEEEMTSLAAPEQLNAEAPGDAGDLSEVAAELSHADAEKARERDEEQAAFLAPPDNGTRAWVALADVPVLAWLSAPPLHVFVSLVFLSGVFLVAFALFYRVRRLFSGLAE